MTQLKTLRTEKMPQQNFNIISNKKEINFVKNITNGGQAY